MAKTKPYQVPLAADLAAEILSVPLPEAALPTSEEPLPRTYGEKLQLALRRLSEAVTEANEALETNQVVGIVARSLAKDLKKRGSPNIVVEPSGEVVLRITYEEELPKEGTQPTVVQGKWHSDLPNMKELRADADELGVDIKDLGKARRAIHERLQDARTKLRHFDDVQVAPDNRAGSEEEGSESPAPPRVVQDTA
jgi:hypothetical protein